MNERTSDWLTRTRVKLPQYAVSRLLDTNFSTSKQERKVSSKMKGEGVSVSNAVASGLGSLSKNYYRPDGTIRSFGEQLYLYERGELQSGDILIIAEKTSLPFDEFRQKDLPLVIVQTILKKIEVEHKLTSRDLEDLSYHLDASPLALESHSKRLLVILDQKDSSSNNLMAILKLNTTHSNITVNEVRSMYADDIQQEVNNTIEHNQKIYKNCRTERWLSLRGIILEPNLNSHLDNFSTSKQERKG